MCGCHKSLYKLKQRLIVNWWWGFVKSLLSIPVHASSFLISLHSFTRTDNKDISYFYTSAFVVILLSIMNVKKMKMKLFFICFFFSLLQRGRTLQLIRIKVWIELWPLHSKWDLLFRNIAPPPLSPSCNINCWNKQFSLRLLLMSVKCCVFIMLNKTHFQIDLILDQHQNSLRKLSYKFDL